MRRWFLAVAVGSGLTLASVGGAQPATVFGQTGMSIDGGDISDLELGQARFVYDDFSLQAGTRITHATWRGFYSLGDGSVNSDNFSLMFFNNTGQAGVAGLGDRIGLFSLGSVSRRRVDGLFEYSDNLGEGLELDPGDYWISIVNQTLFDSDSWFWASGPTGNGYLLGSSLGTASGLVAAKDTFFALDSRPTVVPLPAGWLLMVTGVGLLASSARRWRRVQS